MDYFGYNVDSTNSTGLSGYIGYNGTLVFTCPNTGPQQVVELGARLKVTSGSNTIRLAVYDTSGNFLFQGSAAITVTNTSFQWITHTYFVDVNGNPIVAPKLTGGTNYTMCMTGGAGSNLYHAYDSGATNNEYYKATSYVNGYPSTLGSGWAGWSAKMCIRCGVIPYMPVVLSHYKRMRSG